MTLVIILILIFLIKQIITGLSIFAILFGFPLFIILILILNNKRDSKHDNEIERKRLNRLGLEAVYGDSSQENTILDKRTQKYVDYTPPTKEKENTPNEYGGYIFGISLILVTVLFFYIISH